MNLPPVVTQAEWDAAHQALLAKERKPPARATRSPPSAAGSRGCGSRRTTSSRGRKARRACPISSRGAGSSSSTTSCSGRTRTRAAAGARCSSTRSATSPTCTPGTRPSPSSPGRRSRRSRRTGSGWAGRSRGTRGPAPTSESTSAPPPETPQEGTYQDGENFGLSVFLRDGDEVFRTYFTTQRGVEALGSIWTFLDLTPLGRQEEWEDSPEGYPQGPRYEWWRRHDEYEDGS